MTKPANKKGFSLIELTIVMVIVGLLMAGFFAYLNVQLKQKQVEQTELAMKTNTQSLADFISKPLTNALGQPVDDTGTVLVDGSGNVIPLEDSTFFQQRLPCPAPLDVETGVESCPPAATAVGTTVNGVLVASNTITGEKILIGAIHPAINE